MGNIQVLFWFDVEDFINPESEEALDGILDLLDRRGATGIFKLVGEKARVLRDNGRTDILRKLRRHEIGYHTDWHSVHPVVTEYAEPLGFRDGAQEFVRREQAGFEDVKRITGCPVTCYGQPGLAWAPQAHPALRSWNVPVYLDTHNQITFGGKPFWYGGMLHLTALAGLMGMPLEDGALPEAKREFDRLCELQQGEDIRLISIFYHPTEFVFSEFWDAVNFAKGMNPPRPAWKKPAFRPAGHMRRYLDMVGEFVDYTLARGDVEYVGTARLLELENSVVRPLSEAEIRRLAEGVGTKAGYRTLGRLSLSASELFGAMRRHLLGEPSVAELLYGPERDVPSDPADRLNVRDIVEALRATELPTVCGFRQLPDTFAVGGRRVNPVDLMCTVAAVIAQDLAPEDETPLVRGKLTSAEHASTDGEWARHWIIFPDGLQVPNIVAHSVRQTWTLKPALFGN